MAMHLLRPNEPAPYDVLRPGGKNSLILTCEHAGNRVPVSLGTLGLPADVLELHVGWDIGIAPVAAMIAEAIDAPLVSQPYSRLVIDCNRPTCSAEATPSVSDGIIVPANHSLTDAERAGRVDAIHTPYHDRISDLIDQKMEDETRPTIISLHSFTPMLAMERTQRPWDITLLYNRDARVAERLEQLLMNAAPSLMLAHNEPYTIADTTDYTIPVHGELRGLPSVLIEIRNDHLLTESGRYFWAGLLSDALQQMEPF